MRYLGLVYATLMSSALYDASRKALYTLVLCEACLRVFKVSVFCFQLLIILFFFFCLDAHALSSALGDFGGGKQSGCGGGS